MKKSRVLGAIILLLASNVVTFVCTASWWCNEPCHEEDFQAACILNDICHQHLEQCSMNDSVTDQCGFEELYYSTLENLDCFGLDVPRERVEHYGWAF